VIQVAEMNHSTATLLSGESLNQTKLISLPDSLSGICYLYIFTDGFNTVYENNNENNNILRSTGFIELLKPDLAVSNISIPAIDSTGLPIDLTWEVTNLGQGVVQNRNWTDRIMLSFSPVFNLNSVTQIATLNYDGYLEPGDSFTKEMFVTLPDSIPGPYYIFVQLDCFDEIYENQSEANNVGRSGTTIQILRPDLVITNLVVPSAASSGEPINLEWATKNSGPISILNKSWTDRVLLSPHPSYYQGADTTLGNKILTGSLQPSESLVSQLTVDIPEGLEGDYYVHVYADFNENIDENILENNNVTDTPLHLTISSWADLKVMNIQMQDTALAGSNIPLDFIVKNIGTKGVNDKSWMDKVYISRLPVWDPGSANFLRAFEKSISLAPNSTYDVSSSINLPSGLTAGVHYIFVFTDEENTVFEYTGENNNIKRSDPVYITPLPPVDLVAMNVTNSDSAGSGQPINVQWTVKNKKNANTALSWYDAVYLSTDSIWDKNTDVFFGKRLHYGQLGYGESYNCNQTFYLPNGLSGDYYLLVVADFEQVNNDDNLINNWRSMTNTSNVMQTTFIKLTPPPDLQVTAFIVPTQAVTGTPFKIQWTAKNMGIGDIVNGSWTDKIYLSTDFNINTGDILVGVKTKMGPLLINQSYNDSLEISLPNNLSGNYIMLIKTDGDNTVFEMNENNNTKYLFIVISQPPPSDLFVLDIINPVSVVVGESATIHWTVKNIGQNPANGTAKDMVYFSSDPFWDIDDVLFGSYQSSISLVPDAEIIRSLTAKVNDLPIGYFYAIVRTDVLNGIYENDENNNISTSNRTLYADVRELPIGVLTADTLKDFENLYFRIPIADSLSNETMLTTLKADSINGSNEMYLTHDDMPTRITYDYSSGNPYQGNHELIVPSVTDGNYYMLLFGSTLAGNEQQIDVKAEILNFEIRSVNPSSGGNTGQVTLKITGSKFDPLMQISLENGVNSIIADNLMFIDYSKLFATFELTGILPGVFDLVIEKQNGDTLSLQDGFEIVEGSSPNLSIYIILINSLEI
ncbi:MAG: CARDB domain-containing protein, partial [Bacteroidales bacterium]